ncbi:MAG TPA: sugar phosphate nucleotidyltransferase [Gaiellaceae bacterium]|nr:sugar phosphate nucleotidyltransferase [Gaiellaceae bacterium]
MSSDAVVMAAGEGTRLRPLTGRWAKPVLPIDGRPVVVTLLRALAAAGIGRAWVVVGHLGGQVRALVGDAGLGLDVRFVDQPRPDGSADAVRRALDAGARPPVLVSAADTVYREGDLGRVLAAARGCDGAIAGRRVPPPAPPHRYPLGIRDGRVVRVLDTDAGNGLSGAPLWVVGEAVAARLCEDSPPHELANAFQAAIDRGAVVAGVEIRATRDLTDPLDLVEENVPYLKALGV